MKCSFKYLPGCANDFADLLSRMAEKLHTCILERVEIVKAFPMRRMEFYGGSGNLSVENVIFDGDDCESSGG
jgi:hypothetical protein